MTNCGSGSGLRFADIALDGSLDGIFGGFWASSEHDDATCDGWLLPTAGKAASFVLLPVVAEGCDELAPSDDMADLRRSYQRYG